MVGVCPERVNFNYERMNRWIFSQCTVYPLNHIGFCLFSDRYYDYVMAINLPHQDSLQAWYQGPLGQLLAQAESRQLERILPDMFGYHLLQLGVHGSDTLCGASRIPHKLKLASQPEVTSSVYAHASRLPLTSESIDVCVVSHILEYDSDPHAVLREIDRVLIPEGHVVVLAFNRWGLWGLARATVGWRKSLPWTGKFYSPARIKDWLSVLGFDLVSCDGVFFRPPLRHMKTMHKLEFMEHYSPHWLTGIAGAYVMVARKRTSTLTPIGPRWRTEKNIVNGGLVEPSTRGIHCDRTR